MKILSPKEYKEQHQEAYLDEYITYLEEKQEEIEQVLENAKTFSLSDTVIKEIKMQSAEIAKITEMIEKDLKEILFRSIDKFSKFDLLKYFKSNSSERKKNIERVEFLKEKFHNELKEINEKINNNLYENGRDVSFYQLRGVEEFFSESISAEEYFDELLSNEILEDLKLDFIIALRMEERIQNITVLSDEVVDELVSNFIELLKKCQNILEYSKDAKGQLIQTLYSENGIGKDLQTYFKENPYKSIVTNLINSRKIRSTEFYNELPKKLQQKLELEQFQGEIYQKLLETYQAFKIGQDPINDDLNQMENERKKEIEKDLGLCNKWLEKLNREEQAEVEFLSDVSAMKEALKKQISEIIEGNQITTEQLNQAIVDTLEETKETKEKLEEKVSSLKNKQTNLEIAQNILIDPNYLLFFQAVDQNNRYLVYQTMGAKITEKVLEPFLEAEKRRLQQIKIMTEAQNKLEVLYLDIHVMRQESNFITRRRKKYKEQLERLSYEYKQTIEQCMNDLICNDLLHVYSPDKVLNVTTKVNTFDKLNGLEQSFWDLSSGIYEKTKQKFLKNYPLLTWNDFRNELMTTREILIRELFDIKKDEEGYYRFKTTANSRLSLIQKQEEIVEIIETEYNDRKAKREAIESGNVSLDEEKVQVLESLLGKGNNISQESLVLYIVKTKKEIQQLTENLLSNVALCQTLGIHIPVETTELVFEEEQVDLNEKVKGLGIDGITTIEEAIAYKNILEELNNYVISEENVQQLYLQKNRAN